MDQPLSETGKKHRQCERRRAVSGFVTTLHAVQENQVQVRAIPQFNPAQFTVADNGKAFALAAHRRPTMSHGQMIPGLLQRLIQHRFGDPGEVITHFHQR